MEQAVVLWAATVAGQNGGKNDQDRANVTCEVSTEWHYVED